MRTKFLFRILLISFCWVLLILPSSLLAQLVVNGYVFEAASNEPMLGVSVFYDGTTVGTITDETGYFELKTKELMTTNLVISNIGFLTQVFDGDKAGFLDKIYLKDNTVQLNEVVLFPDTWSRKKKLRLFRKEFLGGTKAGLKSRILNEEDIRLYYDESKNTLFAFTLKPILISNTYLGYNISNRCTSLNSE